jgi:starch synthase
MTRELRVLSELRLRDTQGPVTLLGGLLPDRDVPVYLVEAPAYFCREGNPYSDVSGRDWGDNPDRFLLFARALTQVALGLPTTDWRPNLIHCNDWQTGLAPVLLSHRKDRPATVFTVHNLAYQGLFDRDTFSRLGLAPALWSVGALEFHHRMSFLKGGLVFADRANTVSPTYADEVCTPSHGCGLDGLLRQLGSRFRGILNGIDHGLWDPATDPSLAQHYDLTSLELKASNKLALQDRFALPSDEKAIVLAHIGRLVEQKGIDLILELLPQLFALGDVQLVIQGQGDRAFERRLLEQAAQHPGRLGVYIGYDETRAHLIEAGSDIFLMPSRFEPCGLNQMYSLRYGSVPVLHRTGGLADTVVDVNDATLAAKQATGFLFEAPETEAFWGTLMRAIDLHRQSPALWQQIMRTGMARDFSWEVSARRYQSFYQEAMDAHARQQAAATA